MSDVNQLYKESEQCKEEGKYDEALDSLSRAIQLGYNFDDASYRFDRYLKPLFDNPRFQELVKAKD